jgi:hypothetical protein
MIVFFNRTRYKGIRFWRHPADLNRLGTGDDMSTETNMLRQFDLLQDITQIAFDATGDEFDELILEVELGEGETIKATCRQTVKGTTEELSLADKTAPDLRRLSYELKDEMKNHTGGDLKKYILRIDEEGKANASFDYGNEAQA